MKKTKKASILLEYAVILGVVLAAITAMNIYVKRGIQASIKANIDWFGSQKDVGGKLEPLKGEMSNYTARVSTQGTTEKSFSDDIYTYKEETKTETRGESDYSVKEQVRVIR